MLAKLGFARAGVRNRVVAAVARELDALGVRAEAEEPRLAIKSGVLAGWTWEPADSLEQWPTADRAEPLGSSSARRVAALLAGELGRDGQWRTANIVGRAVSPASAVMYFGSDASRTARRLVAAIRTVAVLGTTGPPSVRCTALDTRTGDDGDDVERGTGEWMCLWDDRSRRSLDIDFTDQLPAAATSPTAIVEQRSELRMQFTATTLEATIQDELGMPYAQAKLGGWPYWLQDVEMWEAEETLLFQLSDADVGLGGVIHARFDGETVRLSWQPD